VAFDKEEVTVEPQQNYVEKALKLFPVSRAEAAADRCS